MIGRINGKAPAEADKSLLGRIVQIPAIAKALSASEVELVETRRGLSSRLQKLDPSGLEMP